MTARERFCRLVVKMGGASKVAARLGVSRAYVDMIRKGDRRPGLLTAYAIERLAADSPEGPIAMRDWLVPSAGKV